MVGLGPPSLSVPMDVAEFLARVVAPGNYLAVCFRAHDRNMSTRFFPRDKLGDAASFIEWAADKNMDAWYTPASFRMATPHPTKSKQFMGSRTQANVQALRCLWFDADVSRPGDGKPPGSVFASQHDAIMWVKTLIKSGMCRPNLTVNSGYGLHLYWILEDALSPEVWRTYAEAFKNLLRFNGALGDISLTGDSARLLRPPGTWNFKVAESPAEVKVISQLSAGDIPNAQLDEILKPYMNAAPVAKAVNYSSGPILTGVPPTILASHRRSAATKAAQSNMPTERREHLFARIAERCGQVRYSLDTHGANDGRGLWYLGFLSLARFCNDGADFVHPISNGYPGYTQAETDREFDRIADEQTHKNIGAPTCAHFAKHRAQICEACPHWGRIVSPYTLGVEDGDLPEGYRRYRGSVQVCKPTKDGEEIWLPVIQGDVYGPMLDIVEGAYRLTFTYEGADRRRSTVLVDQAKIPSDTGRLVNHFAPMGVTLYDNAKLFGIFVVAWLNKLRSLNAVRAESVPPFGWVVKSDGSYGGIAVGGTFYRPDGSEESAPGDDPHLLEGYKPCGSLEKWKEAAALVTKGRPDLQVLVGASFGAPLLTHTGHAGVIFSAWSRASAVGKSSAFQIGTSVWGNLKTMLSLDDTTNAVHYRIGQAKILPAYWDEIHVDRDVAKNVINTFFKLSQGRDKARLHANVTLRETGDWKTILIAAGNRPLMDYVVYERSDTDAGALRLFEFLIDRPPTELNPAAAQTIALAGANPGHAGRVYAKWLAQNTDRVRQLLVEHSDILRKGLGAETGERFYVAGMACVLVGAKIAKSLDLVDFDIPGMYEEMRHAFFVLRAERRKNTPIGEGGKVNLEDILAKFIADHASDRLVTTTFARRGRPLAGRDVVLEVPLNTSGKLAIHVAQKQKLMRIDKNTWVEWCRRRNISATALQHQMEMRWQAYEHRGLMGAGTRYATGNVAFIILPLTAPELIDYNYDYGSSTPPQIAAAMATGQI